ncbi:MAG: hypothetical protein IBJ13_05925 [Sphingopyxis sp.]|nr:hypothetical protein [Sphingopyxis sp.]
MMEEHFMRGWNSGHDRFSADIDRGLKFLGRMLRRWTELVTPSHAFGEDTYFTRIAAACRPAKRAVPARASRRR